jgi:hypothetical protein
MKWRFWTLWSIGNLVWLVVVPATATYIVYQDRRALIRTTTDSDSYGIVFFGVAMANLLLMIVVNIAWLIYARFRRRRITQS